jgi:hypothetical protein
MVDRVTPRDEVLAVATELGPLADARFDFVVLPELRGEEAGPEATAKTPPPTTTRTAATMAI